MPEHETAEFDPPGSDESALDPVALIDRLADPARALPAFEELHHRGAAVLPAVRQGLRDGRWRVRRWCTAFLDHGGGPEYRAWVAPLLRDAKASVRVWAVHTVSCDRCSTGENPLDVLALLRERLERDDSIRVRRQAVTGLLMQARAGADPAELARLYRAVLARESDVKIRRIAGWGLKLCSEPERSP
jgi:hypothetical protein